MSEYKTMVPIYKQLEELMLANIHSGAWPVHSKVKDEIELAKDLNVSRGTLRKAIKSIVSQGLMVRIAGKGTFITSKDIEQPLGTRFISFAEAMAEKQMVFKTIVLKKEIITPDIKISAFLEAEKGDRAVYLERVRLVDNDPVIYLKNYVLLKNCPGIMDDDLENNTLFGILENKYGHKIEWGSRSFEAVAALGDASFNLGVETGTPVMCLEQTAYLSHRAPIEHSKVWMNSGKFKISSVIQRQK